MRMHEQEPVMGWNEAQMGPLGLPLLELAPSDLEVFLELLGINPPKVLAPLADALAMHHAADQAAARRLAAEGEGGDTLLAHLTPGVM